MDNSSPELRAAVAAVERAITSLPVGANEDIEGTQLRKAWQDLVVRMDIGPAPETRECPFCKHTVMKLATRCGYCWHSLEAVGP